MQEVFDYFAAPNTKKTTLVFGPEHRLPDRDVMLKRKIGDSAQLAQRASAADRLNSFRDYLKEQNGQSILPLRVTLLATGSLNPLMGFYPSSDNVQKALQEGNIIELDLNALAGVEKRDNPQELLDEVFQYLGKQVNTFVKDRVPGLSSAGAPTVLREMLRRSLSKSCNNTDFHLPLFIRGG